MMKTIYKYEVVPYQETWMPIDAEILSAGTQDDQIFVWALVDASLNNEGRRIKAICTGQSLDPDQAMSFIGTVPMKDGLVFHIFETTD